MNKQYLLWLIIITFLMSSYMACGCGTKVDTVLPKRQTVIELVIATGRIRPVIKSDIGTEVSGTLCKVNYKEGDRVAKGAILLELDSSLTKAKLEQAFQTIEAASQELIKTEKGPYPEEINKAKAEIRLARADREKADADYGRFENLLTQGVISRSEWEKAKANREKSISSEQVAQENLNDLMKRPRMEDLKIAHARLKQAEAAQNLIAHEYEKHSIKAPYDCLVVARNVESGQAVTAGLVLMSVADMSQLEIYMETDENNLGKIRKTQSATIIAPAFKDRPFQARVSTIGPEVDSLRGVVAVKLTPTTVPDYILPDMTVDVNIEAGRFSALTVPLSAVLESNGTAYLFVKKSGKAVKKGIKVLSRGKEWVAIEGVSIEENIILNAAEVKSEK